MSDDLIARLEARLCEYRCFVRPRVDARDEALLEEAIAVITAQGETVRKDVLDTRDLLERAWEVGENPSTTHADLLALVADMAHEMRRLLEVEESRIVRCSECGHYIRSDEPASHHGCANLAHGETAPAPVDEQHICPSHCALMSAADGCPWCEVAKMRLAAASPLPPGEVLETLADDAVQRVAELPDRTSPGDWPEAMLVTADELRAVILTALRRAVPPGEALEELRAAVEGVVREFAADEAQGYRSRSRQYALTILRPALRRAVSEGSR